MKTRLLLQLLCLLAVVIGQVLAQQKAVLCYFTNWSQYRRGKKFYPEDVNVHLCTHLIYSFAKVSGNRLAPYEWNDIVKYNITAGLYYRFNQLKTKNPALKTLLAVGGWTHGSRPFSVMSSTAANRQEFVNTSIQFLRQHKFDGLDIDWEYPADPDRGGRPADKSNFAALAKELRAAFNAEARRTGKHRLLLTAAVGAGYSKVAHGYDIPSLSKDLDYISVMAYDLHGSWDRHTGHNAGLYNTTGDPHHFSVSSVALNWARSAADRSKILVGLPLYGHTWTLTDPSNHNVGAPSSGPGKRGKYTGAAGTLSYYEICDALNNQGYTRVFDSQAKAYYAYAGNQWISFDDPISLQYKMTWIRQNGFGGSIVWALDLDDFDGTGCGRGPYPLINVIHQCLVQNQNCFPSHGGTSPTTTLTTLPPTVTPKTGSPDCPYYFGIFRDRYNCSMYWICISPHHQYRFICPYPSVFDSSTRACNSPTRVDCGRLL